MASPHSFPYTHYACPCTDLTSTSPTLPPNTHKRASIIQPAHQPPTFDSDHQQPFNPHSPRANYALYPLDTLLWCDECDALRCPRCVGEEVLYWYCPSCLFDVPSSAVRGDGCRCSRSCYDCPSCTAPLAVTQIPTTTNSTEKDGAGGRGGGLLKPPPAASSPAVAADETYILQCQYCDWSSLEINVHFNKPTKITEQLAKQRKARTTSSPSNTQQGKDNEAQTRPQGKTKQQAQHQQSLSHEETFANLTSFYKDQLSESGDPRDVYPNSPYTSSPANLQRIMSLYGGLSHSAQKKLREKPQPMREALVPSEGLSTYSPSPSNTDAELLQKMQNLDWDGTTSATQRLTTANPAAKFTADLWPMATQLRTRRGKRCRTCRQFLARPEPKVGNMRYRVRILAQQHIPRLSIKLLHQAAAVEQRTVVGNAAFRLRDDNITTYTSAMKEEGKGGTFKPFEARHYVLTIRNPLFDPVKITLATPAITPGRVASKVTILCPSFTVGPAGEVWDEALSSSTSASTSAEAGGRKAAMASLTGASTSGPGEGGGGGADRQPEAGKVWQRTRNSTSVVLEIVPGSSSSSAQSSIVPKAGDKQGVGERGGQDWDEDDDVLEVPVYVRVEWETEARKEGVPERVQKEVGFWAVVGVGRIA